MKTTLNPGLVTLLWLLLLLGGCNAREGDPISVYGCYEPSVGPFLPGQAIDAEMPQYIVLDTAEAKSEALPHPEGQYVAHLPADYRGDFVWYAGWSVIGDTVLIDWNRRGQTFVYRLRQAGDTLSGTGVVHTDTQDSVASYSVAAARVACR